MWKLILVSTTLMAVLSACGGDRSVNRAPVVAPIMDLAISANEAADPIAVAVTDDAAAGELTITASSSDATLVDGQGLLLQGTNGVLSLTITPNAAVVGAAIIRVTATDAEGAMGTANFTVTVVPQTVSFQAFFRSLFMAAAESQPRDVNSRQFTQDAAADDFADLL